MVSDGENVRRMGMARVMPLLVLVFLMLLGLALSVPPDEGEQYDAGIGQMYNPEDTPFDPSAIVPRILEGMEQLCDNKIELFLTKWPGEGFRFPSDAPHQEFDVSLKGHDREAFERCLSKIDQARKTSNGSSSSGEQTKSLNQSHATQHTPNDYDLGKRILLGALTAETTEEMIDTHFGTWGALHSVGLTRDEITGESRGFGFAQFEESTSADAALDEKEHVIDGKAIAFERAGLADLEMIDGYQRSDIRPSTAAAAAASPMDRPAGRSRLTGRKHFQERIILPVEVALRLSQDFHHRKWRCCDSEVDVYIDDQWRTAGTTDIVLEERDRKTLRRCRDMMAQLISEEAPPDGGDLLSTVKIHDDRDDMRVLDIWRMCGAQGGGQVELRGEPGCDRDAIAFTDVVKFSVRPGTKYLPISNEEFVFITGVGQQLIREVQKHTNFTTVRVHPPPSNQFAPIPKPATTHDEDISARRDVIMSFTGKTEGVSDFAMTRMRDELDKRAKEIKGFYSAGPAINPGAHLLYVDVPNVKLNILIGSRGSTIEELRTRTGCRIDILDRKSRESKTRRVTIIGAGDSPYVTRSMIEMLVNGEGAADPVREVVVGGERRSVDASGGGGAWFVTSDEEINGAGVEDYEVEINVPRAMIGLIVGLREFMQHDHQVSFQIPSEGDLSVDSDVRLVKLKGNLQSVERCRSQIFPILRHAADAVDRKEQGSLAIPQNKVGLVTGKAGETIQDILDRTGTKLYRIGKPGYGEHANETFTFFAATKDAVDRAKAEVLEILRVDAAREEAMAATSPNSTVLHVVVPNDKIDLIVGKGGSTIKDLEDRTGCRIHMPHRNYTLMHARRVTLTGRGDSPYHAKREIEAMLLDGDERNNGVGNGSGIDAGRGATFDGGGGRFVHVRGGVVGKNYNADTRRKGTSGLTSQVRNASSSAEATTHEETKKTIDTASQLNAQTVDAHMRGDALRHNQKEQ